MVRRKYTVHDLVEMAKKSRERSKVIEAEINANNGPAQEQDLFPVGPPSVPEDSFIWLALITKHPDNKGDCLFPDPEDCFFAIPVDCFDCVCGGSDVIGESRHFGKLVARCGYGIWLTRKDIDKIVRGDFTQIGRSELGDDFHRACRKKVADLARGRIQETESDFDPEYHDHMDIIARAIYHLEKFTRE